MFVKRSSYDRAIAERDGARTVANDWMERAQANARKYGRAEEVATDALAEIEQLRAENAVLDAELAALRQPRDGAGKFGRKVRA